MAVRALRDRRYVVETEGGTYVVDVERGTCTCPDHAIRHSHCKHLRRVAIEITAGRVPAPDERIGVCAVCGRKTFVPFDASGSHLCERHGFVPGDVAIDRESGTPVRVVETTTARADSVETREGRLVADYETNRAYGRHEPVVDAVYLGDRPPRRRYRFPASRLRPIDWMHRRRPNRDSRETPETGSEAEEESGGDWSTDDAEPTHAHLGVGERDARAVDSIA